MSENGWVVGGGETGLDGLRGFVLANAYEREEVEAAVDWCRAWVLSAEESILRENPTRSGRSPGRRSGLAAEKPASASKKSPSIGALQKPQSGVNLKSPTRCCCAPLSLSLPLPPTPPIPLSPYLPIRSPVEDVCRPNGLYEPQPAVVRLLLFLYAMFWGGED